MMANIDVSFLLTDPDFCDPVTLITRASSVNEHGEHVLAETPRATTAVVQAAGADALKFLPPEVSLVDTVDVWLSGSLGELHTQAAHGYSDVLVWRGERYAATAMVEDFGNYGAGFTHALFARMKRHG